MSKKKKQFDIKHIAELAKLNLTKEEEVLFSEQIEEIIAHFSSLQDIDTSKYKSNYWEIQENKVWSPEDLRDDKINEGLTTKEILFNAPSKESNHFKINKILDR